MVVGIVSYRPLLDIHLSSSSQAQQLCKCLCSVAVIYQPCPRIDAINAYSKSLHLQPFKTTLHDLPACRTMIHWCQQPNWYRLWEVLKQLTAALHLGSTNQPSTLMYKTRCTIHIHQHARSHLRLPLQQARPWFEHQLSVMAPAPIRLSCQTGVRVTNIPGCLAALVDHTSAIELPML